MIKEGRRIGFVRGKKGQFYLIAAIIITTIVISIAVVTNYSEKPDYTDLSNLRDEIQIESGKVLDYGINSGLNQPAMHQLLSGFCQDYIDKESKDKNLYFLFGTQTNMTIKGYQKTEHDVSLDGTFITSYFGEFSGSIDPSGTTIVLGIDSNSYTFNLKSGENFYILIAKENEGGQYVVTG